MQRPKQLIKLIFLALLIAGCGGKDPATLKQNAEDAMADGDYGQAIIDLKNILKRQPDDANVRLMLSEAALAGGDVATAVSQARKAAERGAPEHRVQPLLARALIGEGSYEELLAAIDPSVAEDAPTRAELIAARGRAALALGRLDEAGEAFDQALSVNGESLEALLGAARLALTQNRRQAVGQLLDRASRVAPDHPRVALLRGDQAFTEGRLGKARDYYRDAINGDRAKILPRERFEARNQQVKTHLRDGQLDEAKKLIAAMREQSSNHPVPNYLAGVVAYREGEFDSAASHFESVLAVVPSNMQAKMLLGAVKLEQGQIAQAREHLGTVVSNRPKELRARLLYARALREAGDEDEAISVLAEGMAQAEDSDGRGLALLGEELSSVTDAQGMKEALAPYSASQARTIETRLGQALLGAGRSKEAMAMLSSRAGESGSDDLRRRRLRVLALVRNDESEKALRETRELVEAYPDDAGARLFAGNVYVELGRIDKARTAFEAAKRLAPESPAGDLFLGRLALSQENHEQARAYLQQGLAIQPDNASVMVALARVAAREGQSEETMTWLEKARSASPEAVRPRQMLARMQLAAGRAAEAREVAAEIVDIAPERALGYAIRGIAELADGETQAAVDTLRRALEFAPDEPRVRLALAKAQLADGQNQAAIDELQALREQYPQETQVAYLAALAKQRVGDVEDALAIADELETQTGDSGAGRYLRGEILAAAGRIDDAVAALREAADRGQRDAVVRLIELGEQHELNVSGPIEAWLSDHADDSQIRFRAAVWYMQRGEHGKARPHLERLASSDAPSVLNNLALVYHELGDSRALETARRAHERAPDAPAILDTLGWLETLNGNLERGITLLGRAVEGAPDNGEIRYHYAEALSRAGQRARAREQVARALDEGSGFSSREQAEALRAKLSSGRN